MFSKKERERYRIEQEKIQECIESFSFRYMDDDKWRRALFAIGYTLNRFPLYYSYKRVHKDSIEEDAFQRPELINVGGQKFEKPHFIIEPHQLVEPHSYEEIEWVKIDKNVHDFNEDWKLESWTVNIHEIKEELDSIGILNNRIEDEALFIFGYE